VHDAEVVRLGDRLAGLQEQIDGLDARNWTPALEDARQVLALEVLHDDERDAVDRPGVVHAGDVLVLDAARGAGFAREPGAALGALGRRRAEELERHELAELAMARRHDDAHPALTEHAGDLVLAGEYVADPERFQAALS
jgi:hypothetical protein